MAPWPDKKQLSCWIGARLSAGPALLLLFLAAAFLFYFSCLPRFIQGGDTPELVLAANFRLVPHPPGFPLWLWLQHAFSRIVSYGTLFQRAALLNAFFALGALALATWRLRAHPLVAGVVLASLACFSPFREAAVLPDVFALHALLVAALAAAFFRGRHGHVGFLFFLGFANHQTMALLFPAWLTSAWLAAKEKRAAGFLLGSAGGLAAAAALYLSLGALDAQNPLSWGETPLSLWNHFLRAEYGTLQLSVRPESAGFLPLWHLLSTSLMEALPFSAATFLLLARHRGLLRRPEILAWLACLFFSVAFFLLTNVAPIGAGREVLLRFHLMPVLLLVLLAGRLLEDSAMAAERALFVACALPFAAFLAWSAGGMLALPNDSVLEDHAVNQLRVAEGRSPALLIASGDSDFFGLRYVQAVGGEGKGVLVVMPALLFHPWYAGKLAAQNPRFRLGNADRVFARKILDLKEDLLRANFEEFSVITTKPDFPESEFRLTYLSIGRMIRPGTGADFSAQPLLLRSRPGSGRGYPQEFTKKLLFADLAHLPLREGLEAYRKGDSAAALAAWRRTLAAVPYAFPAARNICRLTEGRDPLCEGSRLEEIREVNEGILQ